VPRTHLGKLVPKRENLEAPNGGQGLPTQSQDKRFVFLYASAIMKFLKTAFFCLSLLTVPSLPLWAQRGFVHTHGPELVDAQGKPLLLRGTNLGNWFEPEGYMFHFDGGPQSPREIEELSDELIGPEKARAFWEQWRENYITQNDIDLIKKSGFNSVRVPLHWKFFDSDQAEGFRLLDRLVAWAKKDGIYLILDLHCAPGGQTGSNIDDSWGYPWLYRSKEAQEHTAAIWHRIAARYRNEPIVLGYDLLNEPIPHYPRLQQYNPDLEPVYRKLVAAVRSVDKNHVVILGGAQWDTNFKVFGPPFDSNVMYTFHKYWSPTDVSVIQEYLDFRNKYHVPIWLGESGENKDEWIAAFVKTLEANHVGWCFWPYKKMDATSSVVTFDRPKHWDEIIAFAKLPAGTGNAEKRIAARPSVEEAQEAFDDLLKKVQFSNSHLNPGYLQALGLKADKE
jgi:endoglucanase